MSDQLDVTPSGCASFNSGGVDSARTCCGVDIAGHAHSGAHHPARAAHEIGARVNRHWKASNTVYRSIAGVTLLRRFRDNFSTRAGCQLV
ncbi:hypothetical protein [Burkholderia ambifaria]|uniref:hypothetical protein n=1 Tax=Burkholderia ambifaria TaxID=152480 RepID=UPI000AFAB9F0|nr:hypothetical protein [Burkholderia ambifaria]